MPPTLYVALALLVVVVVRQFAPIVASGLGITIALAVGVWGVLTYSQGGAMAFLGMQVPAVAFFAFVALLTAFEGVNLRLTLKRRRQARSVPAE